MKIAKYLLFLMILFIVALLVFVFTQEGNYKLSKSIIVKNLDQKIVYKYIENLNNWQEFIYDSKKSKVIKDNEFSWNDQKYIVQQKFPNDSLSIIYNNDGNKSLLNIIIKKKNNSTKIIWKTEGNYTYKEKFLALFNGNNNKNQIEKINNYLIKINNNLYREHFYYNIKYDKIINLPEQTIIYKTVNCSISNQEKEIKNQLKILRKTLDSIKINNKKAPFLIYNWFDTETQKTEFKICLEIPKFSDTLFSKKDVNYIENCSYQKVIYKGNKKFLNNFWNNYNLELDKRNLIPLKKIGTIEYFDEKKLHLPKKSNFKTMFLIPIFKVTKVKSTIKKVLIPKKEIREVSVPVEKPEIKEVENSIENKPVEN
jgi:hypothetical protein